MYKRESYICVIQGFMGGQFKFLSLSGWNTNFVLQKFSYDIIKKRLPYQF